MSEDCTVIARSLLFHTFCAMAIAVSIEDHVEVSAEVFLYIAHLQAAVCRMLRPYPHTY